LEEELQEHTNRVKNIHVEEGDCIFVTKIEPETLEDVYWGEAERQMKVRAMGTQLQKLAEKALQEEKEKSIDQLIPKYLKDFTPVFEKASFDRLPEHRQWDHTIELKSQTKPFNSKIYPLSLGEQVNSINSLRNTSKPAVFDHRNLLLRLLSFLLRKRMELYVQFKTIAN